MSEGLRRPQSHPQIRLGDDQQLHPTRNHLSALGLPPTSTFGAPSQPTSAFGTTPSAFTVLGIWKCPGSTCETRSSKDKCQSGFRRCRRGNRTIFGPVCSSVIRALAVTLVLLVDIYMYTLHHLASYFISADRRTNANPTSK